MSKTLLIACCIFVSAAGALGQEPTPTPPPVHKIVTAAQVNGVYRYYQSEFRILALGRNKLKVQFDGIYITQAGSPNMGSATGEASIEGNVATFKPEETQRCEITLVFLPNKLRVTQEGSDAECGFGHNVYATGTYRKIKSGKPKFETAP